MIASEIVKDIMKKTGTTQSQIAALVGMKSQTNVCEALKRDIKISILSNFVNAMGYEVVIQKKKPGRRPEGQYVVDGVGKKDKVTG